MEGCWQQCLELVVVTHGDRVLGDLPWLPVGGWCLQSLIYGYLYFFKNFTGDGASYLEWYDGSTVFAFD